MLRQLLHQEPNQCYSSTIPAVLWQQLYKLICKSAIVGLSLAPSNDFVARSLSTRPALSQLVLEL